MSRYLTTGEAVGPVAIVGVACRLPAAADPSSFWDLLAEGRNATREVPRHRSGAWAKVDRDRSAPGTVNTDRAAFLERVDLFDAPFFRISPREARQTDPQQRLGLELAWEALEDAGILPETLFGTRTGVFVGCVWQDYGDLARRDVARLTHHSGVGQDTALVAGRISYVLGTHGPSLTVNTAFSSSLVALHLAVQSIRTGESRMALVGGVSLMVSPATTVALARFGGLAPDGLSKAFSADADGFGRGEGGVFLVVKPLADAVRDGDHVYAVVRGSAVNADGASDGIAAPNPAAQEALLRQAYDVAAVPAHAVDYVEAHGTGTALGDPVEARALGAALGKARPPGRPLRIGSVKSNVGHTEGAAGLTGLLKVVLSMRRRVLPRSLYAEELNPDVAWDELGLRVCRTAEVWPRERHEPLVAGVSSFGWSGTNAHAVLERPPSGHVVLHLLEEPSAEELGDRVRELCGEDVAGELAEDPSPWRVALLKDEEQAGPWELVAPPRQVTAELSRRPKVAFVCPPPSGRWPGMAVDLLLSEPVFRRRFLACDRAFEAHLGGVSLLRFLLEGERYEARVAGPDHEQPLLFAVQVSLAALLESLGVVPDAVVGEGLGEVAAAHVAGEISLADAARALAQGSGPGSVPFREVVERIDATGPHVFVELCGDPVLVQSLHETLEASGNGSFGIAALRRGAFGPAEVRRCVGRLYTAGARVVRKKPLFEGAVPFLLSGRTPAALAGQAARWSAWLTAHPDVSWGDVVRTAALHRTHFDVRAAVLVSGAAEAPEALSALAEGRRHAAVSVGPAPVAPSERRVGKLATLFTGQGSQRLGMGRDLHGRDGLEAFTQAFDAAVAACDVHLVDRSLTEVTWAAEAEDGASELLHQTRYTQPALFALETALYRQWEAWGVVPDVLLGSSVGELVAAHVAGVLSLADAAALVCARGRLMDELATAGGAMASLQGDEEEVRSAVAKLGEALQARVEIAGLNTPTQTVVSGDTEAVDALVAHFEATDRKATRLVVSHAFHSSHMDGMLEAFRQVAAGLTYGQPSLEVVSNVTGRPADVQAGELVSADYWVKHVRQAVRFADGVRAALDAGVSTFLECGPDGVLCGMAAVCVAENEEEAPRVATIPSLRRNQDELKALVSALAGLHLVGHRVDWEAFLADTGARRVDLPTYAFQRRRYWLSGASSAEAEPEPVAGDDSPSAASVPLRDPGGERLRQRLVSLPEEGRLGVLVKLVQEKAAAVLGSAGAESVPAGAPLKDLGLDSLMAVELRNQLSAQAETPLPATLAFDYPTPKAIAALLLRRVFAAENADLVVSSRPRYALDEPVAILAMACRTPGGVVDPEGYWALLDEGRDAVGPFPDRWDVEDLYDPDPEAVGKSYAREGGFLEDVDGFDAGFFGISPREAVEMDPQQRLVLEVAWEALERAGIRPATPSESDPGTGGDVGVYLGAMGSDYGQSDSLDVLGGYRNTGRASSVLSGRVSYVLSLQGPAVTVDTACSSSLVALHLACSGLRQGECDLALAGGVQVMSTPAAFVEFSRLRGLAPDGRCKAFSADADGTGWSEGCGILVLKRLSDARRDGDRVLALLRGSALNQDGRSQGLTAPNGPSQQRVIRRALAAAGLTPDDVDAVEAHGTGTTLGDPVEAGALAEVFGPTRSAERPLWLGSSKSNLGHAQAAAGVLGVMKVVQSLVHERLPKTLHAETPSGHVAWEGSGLALLQEAQPWPRNPERARRAGVSSFGISGTNAHVVLEEAPDWAWGAPSARQNRPVAGAEEAMPLPLLVSGEDETALFAQAGRWAAWLTAHPETSWDSTVRTAALHRVHFDARAAVRVRDTAAAVEALAALAEGRPHPAVAEAATAPGGKLAVLLTGQGSQRPGMGRGLHGRPGLAAFTQAFDAAVAACDAHLERSLLEVIWAEKDEETALLHQTRYTQPALFVLETALLRQWQAWGVVPDVLLGHSVGELVAAHVAGVLSLQDAAALVCARGRLMDELATAGGAMASLQASEEEVGLAIAELPEALQEGVGVAGLNTPAQTLVSGDAGAVGALVDGFQATGRKTTRLTVSHAFHSHHMDGMLEAFRQVAEGLTYEPPSEGGPQVISNVTGRPADVMAGDLVSAGYWVKHVRQAVRFVDGVAAAVDAGATTFLECGPDAVLCGLGAACVAESRVAGAGGFVPSLRKNQDELETLLAALGGLHVRGRRVDWPVLFADSHSLGGDGADLVDLPTYAFKRQRYWLEKRRSTADVKAAGLGAARHPLLGAMTALADGGWLLTGRLSLSDFPWLAERVVFGTVLMPGTGLLDLALEAARAVGSGTVSELTLSAPLALPERGAVRVQLQVDAPDAEGRRSLTLHSRDEEAAADTPWTLHATGLLARQETAEPDAVETLRSWPPSDAVAIDLTELYARLEALGLACGPAFRGLTEAWKRGDEIYARVVLPPVLGETAGDYGLHPALLDAALHPVAAGLEEVGSGQVLLPFAWSDVTLHATGATELRVRLRLSSSGREDEASVSLVLAEATGQPVVTVGELRLRRSTAEQVRSAARGGSRDLYRVDWRPVVLGEARVAATTWVLGGDGRLAEALGFETVDDVPALLAELGRVAGDSGREAPERLLVDATSPGVADAADLPGMPGAVHRVTLQALADLQALLAEPRLSGTALLWVTRSALGTGPDDAVSDLVHAPLWGLVRSARGEYPERVLRSLDVDVSDVDATSVERLRRMLAADAEPELALRDGVALAARLRGADSGGSAPAAPSLAGTVLITGGVGELGQTVARHLVGEGGVRHLVLTSRRGPDAPGAQDLVASLRSLGAETVDVVACDVAEREELASVLGAVPASRPLAGVFHLAGVVADGLVSTLTPERLARVLRPKVDGAWNLHELTRDQDLSTFVTFSSVVGVMPTPGQSNYAAANTFLDALAFHRRKLGLPALSLAWGFWEPQGVGMTAHLGAADLARIRRQGLVPLPVETGLELLVAALGRPEVLLVPARFLRERPFTDTAVPALFRELLRPGPRRVGAAAVEALGDPGALRQRLVSLPEERRLDALVELVREEVAVVLGLAGAQAVPADRPVKELGLDSLMAVELRNRISARAETPLPMTLAFDYPSPNAVAGLLLRQTFAELPADAASPWGDRGETRRRPQHAVDEPVAVVAMACRTPGGAYDPEAYWAILDEGRDAVGPFPERWNVEALYDPDPEAVGKSYAREGGFLEDVDGFDAGFFGISPREALEMDPQQRLVLEVAWEALERAGIPPATLEESSTGVYVGAIRSDYGQGDVSLEALDGYRITGQAGSVVSGRLSYVLGLQGPSITVDTACSSSLVALHLAAAGLRQGECDLALAGGVHVMCTPEMFVEFSRLRGLAPDGRCKAFSADADGAGWSEGCGVLVLKRLSDARRDGDRVLALIRGSAVNQDGRSQGLTAPNGPSQQRVIRWALSVAGLAPDDVDAVEAHGTGTALGDPVEAGALAEVFGATRSAERPLWLGSSKSNLAHAQAAAGVLGVMKVVQSLVHERLPKTLHAATPSGHVAWEGSGLALLQEARPWPRDPQRVRRAGVSSFGISGTNAHVILEEAPYWTPSEAVTPPRLPLPLLVSGRDETALRAQAGRWETWLTAAPETSWGDVLRTAALCRTHFDVRAAVQVSGVAEASEALRALAEGRSHPAVSTGPEARAPSEHRAEKLATLFTGQGSQRLGMGRDLHGRPGLEAFTQAFDAATAACDAYLERSLLEVIWAEKDEETALLHQTRYTQPALFVLETALFAQWQAWGVVPDVLLGHSVGELVAAHVAGVLSLEDAAALVCARGRLMDELATAGGAMASLQASEEEVGLAIAELPEALQEGVGVAGLNTPAQTLVSGDAGAVGALVDGFQATGRKTTRLTVSHAFHSHHMDGMLEAFRQVAEGLTYEPPPEGGPQVISNVTGQPADVMAGELVSAEYWVKHVRQAVRFVDGVAAAVDAGATTFLECGPDAVLCGLGAACVTESRVAGGFVPSLRKNQGELETLLAALGGLHVRGRRVDWPVLFADSRSPGGNGAGLVDLPTYAFKRQRYWLEERRSTADVKAAGLGAARHPLLGAMTALADGGWLLTGRLSLSDFPWLAEHVVFGTVLMPGTGLLDLALEAARAVESSTVSELTLSTPLVLPERGAVRVQLQVDAPDEEGRRSLTLHSRDEDAAADTPWTSHATGLLARGEAAEPDALETLKSWPPSGAVAIDLAELYPRFAALGLAYGPAFQGLTEVWKRGDEIHARAVLPPVLGETAGDYGLHPALLDAALHALTAATADSGQRMLLPFAWSDVTLHATGAAELRVRMGLSSSGGADEASVSLVAADATGQPVATVGELRLRRATAEQVRSAVRGAGRDLYRVDWQPVVLGEARTAAATWVLGGDGSLAGALGFETVDGVAALLAELDSGAEAPERLVVDATTSTATDTALPEAVHSATEQTLAELQALLAEPRLSSTVLVWVTRSAVATGPDDAVSDLVHAPLWGLVRSARSEHPERVLRLADVDTDMSSAESLRQLLSADAEPELAWRHGVVSAARLLGAASGGGALEPPPGAPAWHVASTGKGSLDGLRLVPSEEVLAPLEAGQVRLELRAVGLNFLDVVRTLEMVDVSDRPMLAEGAGRVLEVGAGVEDLRVGDRVMGTLSTAGGTVALADRRMLVVVPEGLPTPQAATIPVNFLTALYALQDLAALKAGERVLIHAAAGGTGMAAVQLARHWGAEVFATASPGKWDVLRSSGLDEGHVASSRDTGFAASFLAATEGAGVDVVLNSLAGDFVDASLRLLPRGGRFLEMGKTDVRDAETVGESHPGVLYRALDLVEAGPERTQELLQELAALFGQGALTPLPLVAYDLRHAPAAFKHMAAARHVGKLVLQPPRTFERDGTVLVTGGLGELGQAVARHLVSDYGVRHLVLTSRRGMEAPGARELVASLESSGAETVRVAACDVAERAELASVLGAVPAERPLTGVFHLAGVLDDGLVTALTPERLGRVLRPKVDGAWNLHVLTREEDLAAFVLFSSAAGVMGSPGQSSYAAANTFLDALASRRRKLGLPAVSLAWGLWEQQGLGMTAHLGTAELARIRRQGLAAMSVETGLALLDVALARPEAALVPARFDLARLQRQVTDTAAVPALLRALLRPGPRLRRAGAVEVRASELRQRLTSLPEEGRLGALVKLVQEEVAAVLGLAGAVTVPAAAPIKDLGLDSLMAVELRNHLSAQAGTPLPATLAFDYPSPEAIAKLLLEKLDLKVRSKWSDVEIRTKLGRVSIAALAEAGLLDALMAQPNEVESDTLPEGLDEDEMDDDSLLEALEKRLE